MVWGRSHSVTVVVRSVPRRPIHEVPEPELGDVERFRRVVDGFHGATGLRIDVLDAGVIRGVDAGAFVRALRGEPIGTSKRVGKWLIVTVGDQFVVFHFGMTGSLERSDGREPPTDVRVVFVTDRGELRYRDRRKLRGMYLAVDEASVDRLLGDIGADALGISAPDLRRRLGTHRGSVKAALLDQSRVAGIGNFGGDEILWRAGINPARAVSDLLDAEWIRLHRAASQVLRATARAGRTPRGPRWLTGARWADPARCPVCTSELRQTTVAGRSSVWCPTCQPEPGG